MLYMLGLRCPVQLAMIYCGPMEKYRYATVRENHVVRLKLMLYRGLFSPELADGLTYLTLGLLYSTEYDYSPPGQGRAAAGTAPRFEWDHVLVGRVFLLLENDRATLFYTGYARRRPLVPAQAHALRIVIGTSVYVHKGASRPFASR